MLSKRRIIRKRGSSANRDTTKGLNHLSHKLIRDYSCPNKPKIVDSQLKNEMYDAIRKNKVSIVKKLLESGMQPGDTLGEFLKGQTCLHVAALNKATAVLILFAEWIQEHLPLKRKSFANIQDSQGNTPAMLCIIKNSPESLYALKDLYINVKLKNRQGETIYDLAEKYSQSCMWVLEDLKAHPPKPTEIEKNFEQMLINRRNFLYNSVSETQKPNRTSFSEKSQTTAKPTIIVSEVQDSKKKPKEMKKQSIRKAPRSTTALVPSVSNRKSMPTVVGSLDYLDTESGSVSTDDTHWSINMEDKPIGNVLEMKYTCRTNDELLMSMEATKQGSLDNIVLPRRYTASASLTVIDRKSDPVRRLY